MRIRRFVCLVPLCWVHLAAFAEMPPGGWIKGVTDRDPLSYRCGDAMTFSLSAAGASCESEWAGRILDWRRTGDDGIVETGRVTLAAGPFVYRTSIAQPGFVRLEARVIGSDGRPTGLFFDGGAGAETEWLQARREPQDFDEFLSRQRSRLDRVPLSARRVYIHSGKHTKVYAVEIACAGLMPVTGYLMIPHGAERGMRYPANLQLHGYGYQAPHEPPDDHWIPDQILLSINAHGMRLPAFGGDAAYYKALGSRIRSNGNPYAFDLAANKDPETAYFNGMLLRTMRALQYLKTLPEWNGSDLIACGGSQGGMQAMWAAGCGEGVTRVEPAIPWCCDLGGELQGRNRGDWWIKWSDGLGYYDPVNFAKRVPATCIVDITRAGLGDYCCPPSGIAILWNNLRCPKAIRWMQGSTHEYVPPEEYPGRDVVRRQLASERIESTGGGDMTPVVMDAVGRMCRAGGGVLEFAPGEYRFASPSQRRWWVSNHDDPMPRNVFLPITGVANLTLQSKGARFIGDGEGILLALVDVTNVTVRGISFDYVRPYFSEWTLRDSRLVGNESLFPYTVEHGKLVATGNGWSSPQRLAEFFDPTTRACIGDRWWDGAADARFPDFPDGSVVVTRGGYRPNPTVLLYRGDNVVFEDSGVLSSAGIGLMAQRCRDVRVSRWHTREGRYFTSLQADATHFSNCRGRVSVCNSQFEGMVDDAINVHSTSLRIVEQRSPNVIRCRYMHESSVGFEVFLPGERLRFIKAETLEPGDEVCVLHADMLQKDLVELTLAKPVSPHYGIGDAVENADWQPSVDFCRNVVKNTKPRAALFTTPRPVLCESNLFERVASHVIELAGDARYWYESGACRDVVIRDNVFRSCGKVGGEAMVYICPSVAKPWLQKARYHRNVRIERNRFEDFSVPLVKGTSVSNLVLNGNTVVKGNAGVEMLDSEFAPDIASEDLRIRDPFVVAEKGTYFLYKSRPWSGGTGVEVFESRDLLRWGNGATVLKIPDEVGQTAVWAPEVHRYRDKWYLLVTLTMPEGSWEIKPMPASCGKLGKLQPRGTWIFTADSPCGPFVPLKNGSVTPKEWMCLNGTLYVQDGKPYLVFCHEWCQVGDGRMMVAELKPDLSDIVGEPEELFRGSSVGKGCHVTDGPALLRGADGGTLFMAWSNEGPEGYAVYLKKSESGSVFGPWKNAGVLYPKNGGHGMFFRDFGNRLRFVFHRPNAEPDERMQFFYVKENPDGLSLSPNPG